MTGLESINLGNGARAGLKPAGRVPGLIADLVDRCGGIRAARAAFEDYAGAYRSPQAFGCAVAAERFGAGVLSDAAAAGFATLLEQTGQVFSLMHGGTCHVFWRV